ncbi:MAG: cell wall hydrolase [Desulfobulbaceae bacterium]|jgi:N-acetylmuramoyl-L-alanine amidase|nr:cell wall hydrolase [Desulfobulbaceae bacterium]
MTLLEGLLWLTLNVYHEARSESQVGQVAVAQVTLNRAWTRHVSVKEVITESGQFSWLSRKEPLLPDDPKALLACFHSVYLALASNDITGGATYYHNKYVTPGWEGAYQYVTSYGAHRFYKEWNSKRKGG